MLQSLLNKIKYNDISGTLVTALKPLAQMKMLPFESPVITSPEELKARLVKYLGLSLGSRTPVFLDMDE